MIFVTLGTQDKQFNRLLDWVQKAIDEGHITEEVYVQAGSTKFTSNDMIIYDLLDVDRFEEIMDKCDVLITHGGVGSILTGLRKNKKVIAVGRKKEYGEAESNHQQDLIDEFEKDGYILGLNKYEDFDAVLKKIKNFKPRKYIFENDKFIEKLTNYIDTGNLE